jgi:hypothetical protein
MHLSPPATKPAPAALRDLGEALHALQDSWSHKGMPDVPLVPFGDQVNPQLAYGHPLDRGGWYVHDADLPQLYPVDLLAASNATCKVLAQLQHPKISKTNPTPCQDVDSQLRNFAKAATRQEKTAWFKSDSKVPFTLYVNQNFLNGITIPGPGTQILKRSATAARAAQDELQRRTSNLPSELRNFVDSFLKIWIIERNVSAIPEFVNIAEITKQLRPPGVPANLQDWLRKFFAMWLIDDHAFVNRMGHGNAAAEGYAALPQNVVDSAQYRFLRYERLEDAIDAPDNAIPYEIRSVPPPQGFDSAYVVLFHFRTQPHDSIGLICGRVNGNWRVIRIGWGIL